MECEQKTSNIMNILILCVSLDFCHVLSLSGCFLFLTEQQRQLSIHIAHISLIALLFFSSMDIMVTHCSICFRKMVKWIYGLLWQLNINIYSPIRTAFATFSWPLQTETILSDISTITRFLRAHHHKFDPYQIIWSRLI